MACRRSILSVGLLFGAAATAQEYTPQIAEASPEAERMVDTITVAEGLEASLFAAEPHVANPIAFHVDHKGDVYVAETFRLHAGVTDIRSHMDWLEAELDTWTVADRAEMYERFEGEDYASYGTEHDRVRLIRDVDGDGRADEAVVFADGFNDPMAGLGSGVLHHDGVVYYTCIPELWALRDTDGDGVADERDALHEGFGVRTTLLGHDLHGLIVGLDQRLYFSVGDRGFHIELDDGRVMRGPEDGAVFRCNLDGTNLEIVHRGLRNPQELAFDDHGNLFTGDNNSDGADQARWVHIVPGGDSGWRSPYQWIHDRGPWHNEGLWMPQHEGRPADTLPPIANLGNGPSGLVHYPGTGLGDEYRGNFFLCDFRGAPSISGVHTFKVHEKGAGFELGETEWFLYGTLGTDVDFGPDGSVYLLDWVEGWGMTGKGRVYRFVDPEHRAPATATLLSEGMSGRDVDELNKLLAHADRRVRQSAHFELAARGEDGVDALRDAAFDGASVDELSRLRRLHGVWGLGIAGRSDPSAWSALIELANIASDSEVRVQALRVLGDERVPGSEHALLEALDDESPRAQFAAALGCGRLEIAEAVEPLARLLDDTGHDDPTLRHGAVMGLLGCANDGALHRLAADASPHVRCAALLVWRRQKNPALTMFLSDDDAFVACEAARAIHDEGLVEGLPALAALIDREDIEDDAILRRALAANLRLGHPWHGRRLAQFALDDTRPEFLRADALEMLAEWDAPSAIDSVHHAWRPIDPRDASYVVGQLAALAHDGIDAAPRDVAQAWVDAVAAAYERSDAPLDEWTSTSLSERLIAWVEGEDGDVERESSFDSVRVASFEALEHVGLPNWDARVDRALASSIPELRAVALLALERMSPADALARLPDVLEHGDLTEQRVAFEMLGRIDGAVGDELVADSIEQHVVGTFPAELALELVLAAEGRVSIGDDIAAMRSLDVVPVNEVLTRISTALETIDTRRSADEELGPWLDTLHGGDADEGSEVFGRAALSCSRCHATWDAASERVGPNFVDIGDRRTSVSLLESIVTPNRKTSKGFGGTNLFLTNGDVLTGRVIDEDDEHVVLQDAEGERHTLPLDEIDERRTGLSAMPEGLAESLTRTEMRNLIAYLKTL